MSGNSSSKWKSVTVRLWRHPGFVGLKESSRMLTLYLLTGPQTNRIGLFHFSPATASDDLGASVDTIRKGLADVSATFGWHFDPSTKVVYIPSWWRWNPPQNPKHLTGNLKDLAEVPPCALTEAFARNVHTLADSLHDTFVEGIRIRMQIGSGYQNQNQNQNQNQEQNQRAAHAAESGVGPSSDGVDESLIAVARETLTITNRNEGIEHLMDAFFETFKRGRNGSESLPSRKAARSAINFVLSGFRSPHHLQ